MNESNRQYWETGSAEYHEYVFCELEDWRREAWKATILQHFPNRKRLDILDVGCGPGFFSCILSEAGHAVTGIDRSCGMLDFAALNAQRLGVSPRFLCMDINDPQLPDSGFDLVVSRNVTWTLDEPMAVYAQFKRLLRPGGLLLIYDANWHLPYYNEDMLHQVRENERRYAKMYQKEFKVCEDDRSLFEGLPLSNTLRPSWDISALTELQFANIRTNDDIGVQVYTDWEQQLYSVTPLFEICAMKPVS